MKIIDFLYLSKLLKTFLQLKLLALGFLVFISSTPSFAVNVSGFASIVTGKSNNEVASPGLYGKSWSMRTDTRLGLQIQAPINDVLSITGQAVARGYSYDQYDDYEPAIDLFFLSYQLTPDIRIRAGRLRTPLFAISEYIPVGYAYPWVNPPKEVYNPIFQGLSSADSVDVSYTRQAWGGDVIFGLQAGVIEDYHLGTYIKSDPSVGVHFTYNRFPLKLLYRLNTTKVTQRFSAVETLLIPGYQAYEAALAPPVSQLFSQVIDAHRTEDEWLIYHSLALQYQQQDWKYDAEINQVFAPSEGTGQDVLSAYVSVSKFIKSVEYYALFGYQKLTLTDALQDAINNTYAAIPAGVDAMLDQLRANSLSLYPALNLQSKSLSFGLRWDVLDNVALKYQATYTKDYEDAAQTAGIPVDILVNRFSVDMVF